MTVSVGASGTATPGRDYAVVTDFTVTIPANATAGTGTFTLITAPDPEVEGDETIGVSGSAGGVRVTGTTLNADGRRQRRSERRSGGPAPS